MSELQTYLSLCQDYAEASKAYYVDSNPIMTDEQFDALQQSIRDILAVNPEFINECNLFATPQDDHVEGFKKVTRDVPMPSMQDIYTEDDVQKWWDSVGNCEVSPEAKLDGLSLSLIYRGGKLVQASTRGTGLEGDDVTAQARNISNIPKRINTDKSFEVRGEVTMPIAKWQEWNATHSEKERLANPRNAASGALKTLDPTAVIEKGLQFNAYYLMWDGHPHTQTENLRILEWIGFDTLPHKPFVATTLDDIMAAIALIKEQSEHTEPWTWTNPDTKEIKEFEPYSMQIDGVVLKVNDTTKWDDLGIVGKFPKWGVAFKFKQEYQRAKLLRVVWQVANSGKVTPVAEYESIVMEGCTCQRVTMNNINWIHKTLGDLRIGDTLLLKKEIVPVLKGVEHRPEEPLDIMTNGTWTDESAEGITQTGGIVQVPETINGIPTYQNGANTYIKVEPKPQPTPKVEPQPSAADPCPTGERAGLGALSGKSILVSGNFGTPARRKELERLVTSNGATLTKNVSSGVDYYLLPDDLDEWKHKAGSKWEKIQTLCHQSRIINQYEFEAMIK